jgi:hypothetical protein
MSCDCFDVLDACMSWVRALHLAYCLPAGVTAALDFGFNANHSYEFILSVSQYLLKVMGRQRCRAFNRSQVIFVTAPASSPR